jgi:hypothetical protein
MQILEELGTFIVSLALAVALIGVAAVMLYYFNPQQPLDHAKAAFYPLVKPLNKTHVWLGVKPSADRVEVVELKYQYRGRWVDVPMARLTADRAVWLNATDGRPVAVPCSANVTVATRYGTAARSLSFTPVCLQRDSVDVAEVTEVFRQLADYASYVANYVLYKSIPAITAYLRFGSMYVGIQDIAPFAFQAVQSAGAPGWQAWPPSYGAVNLLPLEARDIWSGASAEPLEYSELDWGNVTSVMYRWLNVVVDWNSSALRIWVNNVLAYNGTPPAAAATFTAPQGFRITFTPIDADAANVTLYYQRYTYSMPPCRCLWNRGGLVWDKALSLTAARGRASWWGGWVKMINVPAPGYGESGFTRTIHVLPPAPYLGGDRRLFGAVTPFVVRSLTALRASNGTVFASYAAADGAVKMLTFNTPNGTFYVEEPLRGAVPEGFRQVVYIYAEGPYAVALGFEYRKISGRYYWVPFVHSSSDVECWFRGNWPYSGVLCRVLGRWSVEVAWSIDSNGVVSVYRGGAFQRRTRLGQLSAALAWTPRRPHVRRVADRHGLRHHESLRAVCLPVEPLRRLQLHPDAVYSRRQRADQFVDVRLHHLLPLQRDVQRRDEPNLQRASSAGRLLRLVLHARPTTRRRLRPAEPPGPIPRPEDEGSVSFCTPTRVKIDEDQEHRELNTG